MARGELVKIGVRTPVGVTEHTVQATLDGSKVVVNEPRSNELYLTVEQQNRNGGTIKTHRFLKTEVLYVVEGFEAIARAKRGSK